MAAPMVEIKNIHKRFGKLEVLKGVDFEVQEGETVCLIGSSGSGKSTLLRCINLLEHADDGQILVFGQDVLHTKDVNHFRAKVGMCFQQFNLFANMTVVENCMKPQMKVLKVSKEEARKTAMKYLEKVGMAEFANADVRRISGGQKQRVAIARALCMNPKLMLFDEPTSALDPELVNEVLLTIKRVAKEGNTILLVTHEMNFVKSVANRIIFLENGKIVADGTPKEIFENPTNERLKTFLSNINMLESADNYII